MKRSHNPLPWLKSLIKSLENPRIPFINYILTFVAAILLRNFFESFTQIENHFSLPSSIFLAEIIHYSLSYITICLGLLLLYRLLLRIPLQTIARVILPGFLLLLVTPLVDFIVTFGRGINIQYIQQSDEVNLLHSYLTYTTDFYGITYGIKVEVMLLLIGSYFYARIKQASILRSSILVLLIYSILFLFAISPIIIHKFAALLNYHTQLNNELMIRFYLLSIFVLMIAIASTMSWRDSIAPSRDKPGSRGQAAGRRLTFNILLFLVLLLCIVLGLILQIHNSQFSLANQFNVYDKTLTNIALMSIVLFFITFIDQIKTYYLNFLIALIYAIFINAQVFLACGVVVACFYLYANTPLKLQRNKTFSIVALVVAAFASVIVGMNLLAN